ncbi:hypothetical protein F4777DRAFT_524993 [Nemania sp. FL0916]|nr:hypothetical protein F4777DRAFT_524993 [Nemania sp. FL0916]
MSQMEDIIVKIKSFEDNGTWMGKCASNLQEAFQNSPDFNGFVNRAGEPLTRPLSAQYLAGINYRTCAEYCGFSQLGTIFSFEIFSSGATNYLLPWLALTAQLPFETGENEILANVMSFCYAVGSPMLITYSLATTMLNRHWLRARFQELEGSDRALHPTSKNARVFLQESQQLPLRLSQESGSLASLIILPENDEWWEKLRASVLLTRRGVTLSLVAQILVAVLSWVLTVISVFQSSLGSAAAALALSSGTLWVWLVPVIYGWIVVGTQRTYGTIARALKRDMANVLEGYPSSDHDRLDNTEIIRCDTVTDSSTNAQFPPGHEIELERIHNEARSSRTIVSQPPTNRQASTEQIIEGPQKAFKVAKKRKLMRPLAKPSITDGTMRLEPPSSDFNIPNCLGFSISGDEKQEGPAFNYARIFTWWNMASRVHRALQEADQRLMQRLDLDLKRVPRDQEFGKQNLKGSVLSIARYCGLAHEIQSPNGPALEPKQIKEHPDWNELDSAFYQRIVVAVIQGLFLQWGIIGAAIIIAYLTEVTGLGCRSGAYILYGVVGTLVFFLLFLSSIFSHAAMLRHEKIQIQAGSSDCLYGKRDYDARTLASTGGGGDFRRSKKLALGHQILRVCAVLTRILGRTLAVINAVFIILSTLWELVGFYNNCWCDSTYLSKGMDGWILLFLKPSETAQVATAPWAGSVILSVSVAAISCGVFWLYCRENQA